MDRSKSLGYLVIKETDPFDKDFEDIHGSSYSVFTLECDLRRTEYTGNSDNQSLNFIEDDNTQHSSPMMFVCLPPFIDFSFEHLGWKSRTFPLTTLASPVAAEIIAKTVWTANKFIVLKVMLTDVKLINIHVVRLTGVTTLDAWVYRPDPPTQNSYQTHEC